MLSIISLAKNYNHVRIMSNDYMVLLKKFVIQIKIINLIILFISDQSGVKRKVYRNYVGSYNFIIGINQCALSGYHF